MWITVLSAILAGACFASAGILQQHVASARPPGESMSPRLLADLARQPLWLAGIALAFLSYGFESLALAFGPLSVVQAIMVCELIFSVPLSARLHHAPLDSRSWVATVAVAVGLAVAIVAASPEEGDPAASTAGWLLVVAAAGGLALIALVVHRYLHGVARASLLAVAGAAVMGTQSALLAVTIVNLQQGFIAVITAWHTYLLIIASIVGLLLIQSAFQEGPLAASVPVLDTVEPAVAITIGVALFGETIASGTIRRAVLGIAVVVVLSGIVVLDGSPAVQRLYRREAEDQEEDDGPETVG